METTTTAEPTTSWHSTGSLIKTIGKARRETEVNVPRLDKENIQLFNKAKSDEIDQWMSNGVVCVCDRAGIPLERIMTMRWICTWNIPEEVGGARRAKARLVVRSYTDPDLTTVRSETPTISRLGCQTVASLLFQTLEHVQKNAVKTASCRVTRKLSMHATSVASPCQKSERSSTSLMLKILKVKGNVYGLRTAPGNWWRCLTSKLHKLAGQCLHQ